LKLLPHWLAQPYFRPLLAVTPNAIKTNNTLSKQNPDVVPAGEELLVGKRPHSKRTVEHDESTDEAKSARLDLMPALI